METIPAIQNSYRLRHFVVTKVDMNINGIPEALDISEEGMGLSVKSEIGISSDNPNVFFIRYKLNINNTDEDVKIYIESSVLFESASAITESDLQSSLYKHNAPAIGFPFVRSFINTLMVNAGMGDLILPTFNFFNVD